MGSMVDQPPFFARCNPRTQEGVHVERSDVISVSIPEGEYGRYLLSRPIAKGYCSYAELSERGKLTLEDVFEMHAMIDLQESLEGQAQAIADSRTKTS